MKYYILYNYKSTLEAIVSKSKKKKNKKKKKRKKTEGDSKKYFWNFLYNCL